MNHKLGIITYDWTAFVTSKFYELNSMIPLQLNCITRDVVLASLIWVIRAIILLLEKLLKILQWLFSENHTRCIKCFISNIFTMIKSIFKLTNFTNGAMYSQQMISVGFRQNYHDYKLGASYGWSSSLYCPMRNSGNNDRALHFSWYTFVNVNGMKTV